MAQKNAAIVSKNLHRKRIAQNIATKPGAYAHLAETTQTNCTMILQNCLECPPANLPTGVVTEGALWSLTLPCDFGS